MKKYAISDIHGCANTFKALVASINLSKEDELYILGDYFHRGPDVKGIIDYIWQLQEEGFMVKCLVGNHEEMFLNLPGERVPTIQMMMKLWAALE